MRSSKLDLLTPTYTPIASIYRLSFQVITTCRNKYEKVNRIYNKYIGLNYSLFGNKLTELFDNSYIVLNFVVI